MCRGRVTLVVLETWFGTLQEFRRDSAHGNMMEKYVKINGHLGVCVLPSDLTELPLCAVLCPGVLS